MLLVTHITSRTQPVQCQQHKISRDFHVINLFHLGQNLSRENHVINLFHLGQHLSRDFHEINLFHLGQNLSRDFHVINLFRWRQIVLRHGASLEKKGGVGLRRITL